MAQIIIQRDPSNITKPDFHLMDKPVNLLDWLCDNETADFGGLHCEFLLNGKTICNTWDFEPEECNNELDIVISGNDSVVCIVRPAGYDPYTIGLIVAAVVAAVVVIALTPNIKPPIPGDNEASQSNQLNSSKNTYLKLGEAIDDNAGLIVKYPKFLQPSYYEYDSQGRRVFTEYFLIGVGRHDISQVKEGDTLLSDIFGSDYEYLDPPNHPTSLLNVRMNPSTQDIDLPTSASQTRTITIDNGGGLFSQPSTFVLGADNIDALELSPGDTVAINIGYVDGEGVFYAISGDFTVDTVSATSFDIVEEPQTDSGVITGGTISNTSFTFVSPWYTMEGDSISEVWFHLKMPSGIRKGDGTDSTVNVNIQIEELDSFGAPTGTVYSKTASFFGNTQSPQFATYKFNSNDGIPAASRYRARATRQTASLGDNALDLVVLDGIASVTPYTPAWGDIDAMKVTRVSTQRVNKGASTKINCLAQRKLQTFSSGSTYVATRNFSDYAFYLLRDLAGVSVGDIDTTTLFGIMSGLSDAQLGYFDYQFDSKNSSLRERLNICCNVARVRYYNEGLNWTFTREESRPTRMALFNRRNLKPKSSQFVQKFRGPADHDGVTLVYVDPNKNSEKRISKKISGGAFVDGLGINPLEINLAGCRNDLQALNRLNLEVRRLIYQNIKVTDVSIGDALVLPLGERVDWVDMHDPEIFSGEIMGQKDNIFATSERFEPQTGVDYLVYVTDSDGVPTTAVECLPRSDGTIKGFEAAGISSFAGNQVFQVGSRYVIASANNYDVSAYTLIGKGKPSENGEVQIELAEYNELLFADD